MGLIIYENSLESRATAPTPVGQTAFGQLNGLFRRATRLLRDRFQCQKDLPSATFDCKQHTERLLVSVGPDFVDITSQMSSDTGALSSDASHLHSDGGGVCICESVQELLDGAAAGTSLVEPPPTPQVIILRRVPDRRSW